MATQWMRWNPTTHIFEYTIDGGSTWAPLLLDASVLNEGTLNPAVIPGGGGGSGNVVGPATATDSAVALYSGATGKLIKNSTAIIDATGLLLPGTRPALTLDGGSLIKARVQNSGVGGSLVTSINAFYNGSSWLADDVASGLWVNSLTPTLAALYYSAAAANPRTIAQMFAIDVSGNAIFAGTIKERNRTTPLGEWINIPYSAGIFTASGSMTWVVDAGDVATLAYTIIGRTAFVFFNIGPTTIGGTASTDLFITLPFNPTVSSPTLARIGGATWAQLLCYFLVGQSKLGFQPFAGGNFTLGTNVPYIQGMAVCQV